MCRRKWKQILFYEYSIYNKHYLIYDNNFRWIESIYKKLIEFLNLYKNIILQTMEIFMKSNVLLFIEMRFDIMFLYMENYKRVDSLSFFYYTGS